MDWLVDTIEFYRILTIFDSMNEMDQLRKEYQKRPFGRDDLANDPIEQFRRWFDESVRQSPGKWYEPNAMTIATADRNGLVTARTVLLKNFDETGFMFFTNYTSEKGRQLAGNPQAALLFHWHFQGRQIRIDGTVEKTSRDISEQYFHSRPRAAQIAASASDQSGVAASRDEFEHRIEEVARKFDGQAVALPDSWGGYLLIPQRIEFWQGREDRTHDRFRYRLDGSDWIVERLFP